VIPNPCEFKHGGPCWWEWEPPEYGAARCVALAPHGRSRCTVHDRTRTIRVEDLRWNSWARGFPTGKSDDSKPLLALADA
jgi:hypothetical protein